MKKILLSIALLGAAATVMTTQQSCTKDLVKLAFAGEDLDADPVNITIPVISSVNSSFLSLDTVVAPINIDQQIKDATGSNFGLDDADKMYFKNFRIVLDAPDSANNWANFTDVQLYVWSNTNTSSVLVAEKLDMPDTYAAELELPTNTSLNMKDYLSGQTIYYAFVGANRRATSKALTGKAHFTVRVE